MGNRYIYGRLGETSTHASYGGRIKHLATALGSYVTQASSTGILNVFPSPESQGIQMANMTEGGSATCKIKTIPTTNVASATLRGKTFNFGFVEFEYFYSAPAGYQLDTLPFLSTPGEFTVDASGNMTMVIDETAACEFEYGPTNYESIVVIIREKNGTQLFNEAINWAGTGAGNDPDARNGVYIEPFPVAAAGGASDEIISANTNYSLTTSDTEVVITTPNYTTSLPAAAPADGEVLTYDTATGNLIWSKPMLTATEKTQLGNIHAANMNKTVIDETANTLTVYADDGTTILKVFDLKDASGTASTDAIAQRIPQ